MCRTLAFAAREVVSAAARFVLDQAAERLVRLPASFDGPAPAAVTFATRGVRGGDREAT